MEKLLILGSDYNSINVAKLAKRRGMYVIVADLMKTSPTKQEADETWLISTTETDLLEKKCREAEVTAVMFGASDFNISQARLLCRRLNLPIYCDNDYTWEIARNKRLFKDICREVGAPIADDYFLTDTLTDQEISNVKFPVVVKPSDKSGNIGMSYCNNPDELREAWQKARDISDKEIVVERQLKGPEFNVHYAVADSEMSLLYFSATHHQSGEENNLYSFKYTSSCHLSQYLREVNEKAIAAFKRAGVKEGIVWADVMLDEDGKFYLLEMGYRFGGVMTYMPYDKVFGFNAIDWMIDCACGIKHKKENLPKPLNKAYKSTAASYHLFCKRPGRISKFDGLEEIGEIDGVWVDCPKRKGDEIRFHVNSGLIGIYGEDINDLIEKIKQINEILSIQNSDGEDMIIKFTDTDLIKGEYERGLLEFEN